MYYFIVSFILGIVFEKIFAIGWSVGIFIFLISFVSFFILKNENKTFSKNILIIGIMLALGILRMSFVDASPPPILLNQVGNGISFEAKIIDEPDRRDTSVRYVVELRFCSECTSDCMDIFLLKNSCVAGQSASQGNHKHIPSKSLVLITANRLPEYHYGDMIKVSGKLELPKNFIGDNGEEFDYVSYLAKDKIHFQMYQPKIELAKGAERGVISFLYDLKYIFIEKISKVVPEPNSSLLAGMIFGLKQSLGTDLLDQFKKVGLIHIVVLSGQNITIIAAGVFFLTSYLFERRKAFILSAISILLFSLMVGLTATVLRGAIMALIAILTRFLGRPSDGLRWLLIAAFLMLIYNPLTLFNDPSFQLSFMATLGLILFTPIVFGFISKKISVVPTKFGIREIISSTLAVQLFILPLLIKMSGQISLVSFFINPIILPFTASIMALGGLTGALGLFVTPVGLLAWIPGSLAYLLTQFVIKSVELASKLPLSSISIGSLSNFAILIWYAFYGLVFYKLKNKN